MAIDTNEDSHTHLGYTQSIENIGADAIVQAKILIVDDAFDMSLMVDSM